LWWQEADADDEPLAEEALRDAAHDGLLPAATMPALPDDVLDSAASAALERSDRMLPAPEALADFMEVSVALSGVESACCLGYMFTGSSRLKVAELTITS